MWMSSFSEQWPIKNSKWPNLLSKSNYFDSSLSSVSILRVGLLNGVNFKGLTPLSVYFQNEILIRKPHIASLLQIGDDGTSIDFSDMSPDWSYPSKRVLVHLRIKYLISPSGLGSRVKIVLRIYSHAQYHSLSAVPWNFTKINIINLMKLFRKLQSSLISRSIPIFINVKLNQKIAIQ